MNRALGSTDLRSKEIDLGQIDLKNEKDLVLKRINLNWELWVLYIPIYIIIIIQIPTYVNKLYTYVCN